MKNYYLQASFVLAFVFIMTGNALSIEGKRDSGTGFETGMPADSTLQNRYHDPGLKKGVQHLGFQVEDPDKTSAELAKAGYPIFHHVRYDSDDGTYIYHETLDALGVVVELLHSDTKK